MQKQQFGIMDEGYFVPKSEILTWINALLHINITKIQALGSGSIYCQIFDVIHPGKINLAKVNWKSKNDTDFLANFRLLQTACQKSGIKRHIEVQKLVKTKYQDNLQFIQWLKRYFDTNCGNRGEGYDAVQKRNKVVPDFSFCQKVVIPKVYNSSGQVGAREKITSSNAKKEQLPPRVKSPKNIKTPVVIPKKTPIVPKKTEQKKEQPKKHEVKKVQDKKEQSKKIEIKKTDVKKTQAPKTTPIVKRPNTAIEPPKRVTQPTKSPELPKGSEVERLKKALKEMTQKLQMIKEIVISHDGSYMKVEMIKEVLNIAIQKQTTQQTVSVSQNLEQHSTPIKQEVQQSVTENVSNANEDLLMNDEPQSEQAQTEQLPVAQTPAESQQEDPHQEESHQEESHQEESHQEESHQEESHQEESHQEESHQEDHLQQKEEEVQQSETHQDQSHPEQKPDLSQVAQSEHDDDII